MDLVSFTELAERFLDELREALAVVEEAAQADDNQGWLDLSKSYALLVSPIRDYLAGAASERPLPRHLAKRLRELRSGLVPHAERIELLALHPTLQELDRFARDAETVD